MGSQSLFHHNKPDYISHIFINHLHLNWAIYSIKTQMLDIRSVESKPKVASSLILITADRKGTLLILMCYLHLLKTALWSLERVWQTKIKNSTLANKMLLTDRSVTTFRQTLASDHKTMNWWVIGPFWFLHVILDKMQSTNLVVQTHVFKSHLVSMFNLKIKMTLTCL